MIQRTLAAAAILLSAAAPAAAGNWEVDHEESRVGFIGTQLGNEFEGHFEDFSADIVFHPDDLEASAVSVTIDVASFDTGSADRDSTAMGSAWFDVEEHPQARFEAETFRHLGGNDYEADGRLTIKGTTREVTLPFTLDIRGDTAEVSGRVAVDRTEFDLGTGDWATGETVGLEVTIAIDLTAVRAG
jgi:polyisoprenoid-binding protein YceI